jgi:hypothetical protein
MICTKCSKKHHVMTNDISRHECLNCRAYFWSGSVTPYKFCMHCSMTIGFCRICGKTEKELMKE